MPTIDIDVPETTLEVDIEVWCLQCGAGLCHVAKACGHHGISVEPCKQCMAQAREGSYNEGYDAGYEDAGGQ